MTDDDAHETEEVWKDDFEPSWRLRLALARSRVNSWLVEHWGKTMACGRCKSVFGRPRLWDLFCPEHDPWGVVADKDGCC